MQSAATARSKIKNSMNLQGHTLISSIHVKINVADEPKYHS